MITNPGTTRVIRLEVVRNHLFSTDEEHLVEITVLRNHIRAATEYKDLHSVQELA